MPYQSSRIDTVIWFLFMLWAKTKCQLSGCLFSPENEWQWQLWCAITRLLWFVFTALSLDACEGTAMKVEHGVWDTQIPPPYFLIRPYWLGGKMGEKKVQCHNPGLFPVPGRLLLSLSSGKIPKKKHQEEKWVYLWRNTLVFQTLNTLFLGKPLWLLVGVDTV